MFPFASSLKTRILVLTGSVVILLMLLISFGLLLKWRDLIIQKQSESARAIAKTFAVTVVDAMIFEENTTSQKEGILDTYVDSFIKKLGTVHYVVMADPQGAPLLSKTGAGTAEVQAARREGPPSWAEEVHIFRDPRFGWVMEVNQPILLAGKRWGATRVGFDAQPIRDEIASVFFMLLTATILVTGVVLAVLYFSVNRITASLGRLVTVIDTIDLGSGAAIPRPLPDDEAGFLYGHFNLLRERLENSRRELERAQKQIYQAEKLASIGRLASGVAHEINNPLNGIKSCLYALQKQSGAGPQTAEYLVLINEGIENIETVVKKLLGFARQQPAPGSPIDVNDAVRRVARLFDLRLQEKQIDIALHLDDTIPNVAIDSNLFQEVVMNLLLNSADAVEREGSIGITSGREGDGQVFVEVRDTGCGIAQEDLKKIFDPFFTTKEVGMGTGLGLSVCLGIVESHGGKIHVQSTKGEGTTFRVILPTVERDETAAD